VIRGIFGGRPGPARDIVLANAAAALIAADRAATPLAAMQLVIQAVDSGGAAALCDRLIEFTNRGV
jgi:anthranilate phosphoribosyltransferase